jgi:hypothetical protein
VAIQAAGEVLAGSQGHALPGRLFDRVLRGALEHDASRPVQILPPIFAMRPIRGGLMVRLQWTDSASTKS